MAMTGVVKDELSRVQVIKPCCRKAEVSTLLRFAGGLHLSEGRVIIETILSRCPNFAVGEPERFPGIVVRGISRLPVHFQ